MHKFAGIYTPLATPFAADGSLDARALARNVDRYLTSPLTGLVVLGSNGEAPQLDEDESDLAIKTVRDEMPKDRPLLAGTGRESTAATIAATKRAADLGVDAVLVRTPSFYKGQMTTDAFVRHYTTVADRSPVPVLLYNVTMYTGVNLLPDAIGTLSRHPNIVGVKETNSDMVQFGEYLAKAEEGFTVLAGSGATYYSALALGAHGAILAVGGVAPKLCTDIFNAVRDGRFDEAKAMHRRLAPLSKLVGAQYGVPGLKAAITLCGLEGGHPRPPLQPVPPAAIDAIRAALAELHLLAPPRKRRAAGTPSAPPRKRRAAGTPWRRAMLPTSERILLGPGPSLMAPSVTRALGAPMLSHLDPQFVEIMDDVRARLARVFRAEERSFAFAVSGTGTAAMETAIANLVAPGSRVLSVVTGYFAERLAQMAARYGGDVKRVEADWGRAIDPDEVRQALKASGADVVTIVHAETSTGVLNPVKDVAAIAREHGALVIVDAVTSLGGMPLDAGGWGLDAVYSCSQKCLGAPSGMSPIVFSPRALEKKVACRSFYFDVTLLEDYWVRRKYHHTMSASLIYALREALVGVEAEGLQARWARHERNHLAFAKALDRLGLSFLPSPTERLWTLNAVNVPHGIDDAAVRKYLLENYNIEIGAGLGPLAGKVFRIGLMGTSSSPELVDLLTGALETALNSLVQGLHKPGA